MSEHWLYAVTGSDTEGRTVLGSPAVGVYTASPRIGEGLVPGSTAGVLRVLGRRFELRVPEATQGVVVEVHPGGRAVPVAYGEPLLTLAPAGRRRSPIGRARKEPSTGPVEDRDADGVGAGRYALRAPTTGVFYARPDPASPPFVSKGSSLESGQTAGLIEVMKCFSPIVHPGGATPSPLIVEEVRAREGDEVRPGQVLFVLRAPGRV